MSDRRHTAFEYTEDDPVLPHVLAASENIAATLREEAAAMAAAREARIARQIESEEARARLAAQRGSAELDDGTVPPLDDEHAAVIAETPDNVRHDGWTAWRRRLFLDRLGEHGSVISAARAAGVTRQSVYKLRARAPAFAAAMDEALRANAALLADVLFDRAMHGHEVPVLYQGEIVATRTVHHDALGLYLLRVRDPLNYAPIDELERWKKQRAIDAPVQRAALDPAPPAIPAPTPGAAPDPVTLSPLTTSSGKQRQKTPRARLRRRPRGSTPPDPALM